MEEAKMNGKANVLLYFICGTQMLKYYRGLYYYYVKILQGIYMLGNMKGEKC